MPERALVTRDGPTSITIYDPERGLRTIAVAEASEKHWARAKDQTQLLKAIETKLKAQADYVVWRDGVVVPSRTTGGPGGPRAERKGKRVLVRGPALPDADPGKQVAERWRQRFCAKEEGRTAVDEEKLAHALNDARLRCTRICEQHQDSKIRGTEGTGEFERYTPAKYIEAAREVLGRIDLDPASSKQAQKVVKARKMFTAREDGLEQEWNGNIWLNPPYHRELGPAFIKKLLEEIAAGRTKEAILLNNNGTDTDWFKDAAPICASVCFTVGRVKFLQPNGVAVLPTQGQAFFYFGRRVSKFEGVFCSIGNCFRPSKSFEREED
jgi:hypothetical protein